MEKFKGNIFTENDRNYPEMIYKTGMVSVREFVLVARVTKDSNYAIYCELNSYEPVRVYMGINGDEIPSGYHRTKKLAIVHGLKIAKDRLKYWNKDLKE